MELIWIVAAANQINGFIYTTKAPVIIINNILMVTQLFGQRLSDRCSRLNYKKKPQHNADNIYMFM